MININIKPNIVLSLTEDQLSTLSNDELNELRNYIIKDASANLINTDT
jgi:hypothetical protein